MPERSFRAATSHTAGTWRVIDGVPGRRTRSSTTARSAFREANERIAVFKRSVARSRRSASR